VWSEEPRSWAAFDCAEQQTVNLLSDKLDGSRLQQMCGRDVSSRLRFKAIVNSFSSTYCSELVLQCFDAVGG